MQALTQIDLATYEKVSPPNIEKSNFLYSFSFLPPEERMAINSIYAFCSYIDDIVDSTPTTSKDILDKKLARLSWWEKEIDRVYLFKEQNPLIKRFSNVVERFVIPKQYFLVLIDGCRRDLVQNRYETFNELKEYCYCVASTVGLMSIEIFGYKYEETKNYAINLGYALQLTNILRDVKVDKDRGFIYLPKEDMEKFHYSEEDLINEVYNDNFINLMKFEVQRVREYYYKARTSLRSDEKYRLFPAEIMDAIYYRLLEKIELNDYNVFEKKIKVSNLHKIMIALKHWLSIKIFINRIKK
ncbi:MAG: squalene/phytoene synthase family protein [Candidatus Kapabacteria bacterium]|nr:squalene/phytoene synthase family protein [Candidatus Kapabacteria bacterium]